MDGRVFRPAKYTRAEEKLAEPTVVPEAIRRRGETVEIVWSRDHVGQFSTRGLRLACPCARCIDEISGAPLLDPATVPLDVRADAISPVGAYGIRFSWSDGHGAGIYTYAMLRERCPCPNCASGR